MISDRLANRIQQIFQALLPSRTEVAVGRLDELDLVVDVQGNRLRVRPVSRGDLRSVGLALHALPRPDIIVAPRFTEAALDLIRDDGVNWADETGAAEIRTDSLLIMLSGKHQPPPRRSGWTSAVTGVAEALLSGVPATADAMSRATGYSVSTGVRALAFLSDRELVRSGQARGRSSGRTVADSERLLGEYSDAVHAARPLAQIQCGVLWRHPFDELETLGEKWTKVKVRWAVAGAVAASIRAPYLQQTPTGLVYLDAQGELGILSAASQVGLEPLKGGRLTLRPFPTKATRALAESMENMMVTSWPRTYADLRFEGVRGEEAAEHLREVSLGV